MNEATKNRAVVEKFGHFIDHKKASAKNGKSFEEQMENVSGQDTPAVNDVVDTKEQRKNPLRGGRRYQPPRLAKSVPISKIQAERIARYAPLIESAARKYGVPVELICGVILQESGGNARAVSHCGARGLMQLMPATGRRFGVTDPFNPAQNIEAGTRYLRFLLDRFDGKLELAIAGYNAGEGNVEKYGRKIPPFAETKAYVPMVLGYTQSMIDIFYARLSGIPTNARRV